ncbi:S41 family peptidase [Ferrimonas gelatinilytica]|uniref:S41 family peptidase n=1 Tax=Ferrimonas gelatinilytica TaxID=1255257 RepID=A0ABP9RVT3_9GAMM
MRRTALLVGLLFAAWFSWAGQELHRDEAAPTPESAQQLVGAIAELIRDYYVDDVPEQALLDGALRGMLESLDPHSSYLSPTTLALLRDNNRGQYYGYGLEVAVDEGKIRVITPLGGSSAEAAGILPGDILLQVDDLVASADNLDPLIAYIKQSSLEDRRLLLTLARQDSDTPLQIRLSPTQIQIASSNSDTLPNNVGYLRISNFSQRTVYEVRDAALRLQRGPLAGLVVDLRNNPGGLLDAAVQVADMFLTQGTIVTTSGRFYDANSEYRASSFALFGDVPLVVLINQGSASAAEILAGALKDNERALLVGERSYGKGTVQSLIPLLGQGGAIKLTTARYATPAGREIDQIGIEPDFIIPLDDQQLEDIVSGIDELKSWKDDRQLLAAYDILAPAPH